MLANYSGVAFSTTSGLAVADYAEVEVRLESTGDLADIFEDRDGATPLDNPFDADEFGRFTFYAAGGAYSIKVTYGAENYILHYQGIGTNSEIDIGAEISDSVAIDQGGDA